VDDGFLKADMAEALLNSYDDGAAAAAAAAAVEPIKGDLLERLQNEATQNQSTMAEYGPNTS